MKMNEELEQLLKNLKLRRISTSTTNSCVLPKKRTYPTPSSHV